MKKIIPPLLWLIIVVAAIIPTAYFVSRLTDPIFRDSAMGNWFATMVGALVGILIALEINRIQQETAEKNDSQAREKEEILHTTKILSLVKKELEYNRDALSARQKSKEGVSQRIVLVSRLKDELWNAFSDGGELQWIKDLELLDTIANAYYFIRTTIFLEEKYFEATHFPGLMAKQDKFAKDYILEYLTASDPDALKYVEEALKEIERSLATLESKVQS